MVKDMKNKEYEESSRKAINTISEYICLAVEPEDIGYLSLFLWLLSDISVDKSKRAIRIAVIEQKKQKI